ncbi:MAG: ABC transporter substrate-binding protein [Acidobacteria bacterium]|nr:MAG: ABC transporter substrate-binding protein [Acidobacteriota bacterium]
MAHHNLESTRRDQQLVRMAGTGGKFLLYRFRSSVDSKRQPVATVFGIVVKVVGTEKEACRASRLSLLMSFVLCIILFAGCQSGPNRTGSKQTTIAVSPLLGSAAIYVAHEKGYFKDEGLDAALQIHASGQLSLQAVLSGKADFGAVAETPIAYAAVGGKPFSVVATISQIERGTLIVARKDRGILQAGDLKGKRVGVAPGTTGDFFLHIYLTTSYINPKYCSWRTRPAGFWRGRPPARKS